MEHLKVKCGDVFEANFGEVDSSESGLSRSVLKSGSGRSVLILRNNGIDTDIQHPVLVAPIMFQKLSRLSSPYIEIYINDRKGFVQLENLKSISKEKLSNKIGNISQDEINMIDNELKRMFSI